MVSKQRPTRKTNKGTEVRTLTDRVSKKAKRIYSLLGAKDNLALNITAGPHKDTQELQVHAFRWMNQHLKNDADALIQPAEKFFAPQQLKVFDALPSDSKNSEIQEHFITPAVPSLPANEEEWNEMQASWMKALQGNVFAGWPERRGFFNSSKTATKTVDGLTVTASTFCSQCMIFAWKIS